MCCFFSVSSRRLHHQRDATKQKTPLFRTAKTTFSWLSWWDFSSLLMPWSKAGKVLQKLAGGVYNGGIFHSVFIISIQMYIYIYIYIYIYTSIICLYIHIRVYTSFSKVVRWKMKLWKCLWHLRIQQEMGGGFGISPPWNELFAPENGPSQKELSSSNHPFSGANC